MQYRTLVLLGFAGAILAVVVFLDGDGYHIRNVRLGESVENYLRAQIQTCLHSEEGRWRGRCFNELGDTLSSQFDLATLLTALATIDEEPGIKQQCHTLVHFLGQGEFRKTRDLAGTFRQCLTRAACGEGCFHGAVEAYVSEHGGAMSPRAIQSVCERAVFENEVNYLACNHGLGHAFMLESGNDVPSSLKLCDALSPGDEREQCYAGVFMENVFSFLSLSHPTTYIKPDDPLYPCRELADPYLDACYGAQASFVIQINGSDYVAGAEFCEQVPEQYRASCFGSLGANAVVVFDNPESIKAVCDHAPAGLPRRYCIKDALIFLGHGSEGDPNTLAALCFAVDGEAREQCFRSAGDVLESWFPEGRSEKCALVDARGTKEYEWCVS